MTSRFKAQLIFFARIVLGVVLIYASYDKILHPADFAKAIGNYNLVPLGLENLMALVMPWMELLVGLGLIAGVMVDGAAVLAALMMVVFIVAISQALARGIDIECGCFKVSSTGGRVGIQRLVEDGLYLVLAIVVLNRGERRFEIWPKSGRNPISD